MTGIRISQLEQKLGLKKSKIYLLIESGLLPRPCKIGTASIWIEEEVDEAFIKLVAQKSIRKDITTATQQAGA